MEKMEEYFEVCVVGGGVMGSCAAFSLAEAGKSTVLVEQFPIPHTRGSSSGHSRITSLSDFSSPKTEKLVHHGYKNWLRLLATAAVHGTRRAPLVTVGREQSVIQSKAERIEGSGVPVKWLDIDRFNADYKAQIPSDRTGVMDTSGMVLVANKCVYAAQKVFQGLGGVIFDGWPVKQIEHEGDFIKVVGPRGIVSCNSLVLCPGPWAGNLLSSIGLDLPLRTLKTGIWYYKVKHDNIPTNNFNDLSIPNEFYYSTPSLEYPGLIKFGIHEGIEISPEEREKTDMTHLKEKVSRYLEEYFPQIESEPSIEESCMYTMTPDEDFILDYHPQHRNIVFACGFSGRGFQLAPAIGEVLSGMVLGREEIHDMSPFRASRFTRDSKASKM